MSHHRLLSRLVGMTSLIVIGGGYAGLLAANRAAAQHLDVTLVSDREVLVDRIRLHEVIAGSREPGTATRRLSESVHGPRLVLARAVRVADGPEQASVTLDDGGTLTADHVVLATGSGHGVGGWEWALRHREAVRALPGGATVCVLGGGFTGIETAAEVAEARPDLHVTLADPVPVGSAFSAPGRTRLLTSLARLGVAVSSTPVDADHVIECTGFTPDSLAVTSGLPTTPAGFVEVDEHLRVRGARHLWACGDAARVVGQPHLRMSCAGGVPMAAHLADTLGRLHRGQPARPVSVGYAGWCLSLGRHDGLIQWVDRDDSPTGRVTAGRLGAVLKELVCRFAVLSPIRWARIYRGLEGPRG